MKNIPAKAQEYLGSNGLRVSWSIDGSDGNKTIFGCSVDNSEDVTRIAVCSDGEIKLVFPRSGRRRLSIPYSRRLLAARYLLVCAKTAIHRIDLSDLSVCQITTAKYCEEDAIETEELLARDPDDFTEYEQENDSELVGIEVDPTGTFAIVAYCSAVEYWVEDVQIIDNMCKVIQVECGELCDIDVDPTEDGFQYHEGRLMFRIGYGINYELIPVILDRHNATISLDE